MRIENKLFEEVLKLGLDHLDRKFWEREELRQVTLAHTEPFDDYEPIEETKDVEPY